MGYKKIETDELMKIFESFLFFNATIKSNSCPSFIVVKSIAITLFKIL